HPRLRVNDLVGTDLVQAIPLTGAAALGHLLAGDVRLGLAAAWLIGAIPGIYAGAKLSTSVPGSVLKWILAVLLLASGLQLWGLSGVLICGICGAFALTAVLSFLARSRLRIAARLS